MKKVVNFCDYFVLCSGNTDRHVRAIADGVGQALEGKKVQLEPRQGARISDWIVIDLGDVVTHIFSKGLRDFYKLEFLWREAKRVPWKS